MFTHLVRLLSLLGPLRAHLQYTHCSSDFININDANKQHRNADESTLL